MHIVNKTHIKANIDTIHMRTFSPGTVNVLFTSGCLYRKTNSEAIINKLYNIKLLLI